MGIDELLEELGRRARKREEEVRREAEDEAGRILERARAEVEEVRQRRLEEAGEELRASLSRKRASLERAAEAQVWEARAEMLDRVRERARELLEEAADGEAYRQRLPDRLRQARSCLPEDEPVVVHCPPWLEDAVRGAVAHLDGEGAGGEVDVEVRPETGAGFEAAGGGGDVVVDATLGRLLDREWEDLALRVDARLEKRWAETGAP